MLAPSQIDLFCQLFEDLEGTIEECNYEGHEVELIGEMLNNHLAIDMTEEFQIKMLFDYLMKHQGKLEKQARNLLTFTNMGVI
jgi:hypothetical protein